MQKKLIALAVAGLVSAPAFAQSNVTIYGIADVGLGYIDGGKAGDLTGLVNGGWAGSRLGFRGTEDLGNGLKAVFTLEYGIELDNNQGVGGSALPARQQFVGLSGGFGTLVLGRVQSPGYNFAAKYVPMGGYASVHDFLAGTGAGFTIEDSNRLDNTVVYMTPNFSGFSATVAYSFGSEVNETNTYDALTLATGGTNEADSVLGVGLNYDNGPLSAGLVYHGVYNVDKVSAGVGKREDINEWALGGSYDFGVAKAFATYQMREISYVTAGERDYEDDVWTVGVAVPVGAAGSVSLAYGQHDGDGSKNEADAWSLAYSHALSKRTSLYAMYARMSTEDGFVGKSAGVRGKQGLGLGGGERVAIIGGEDYDRVAIGVRHSF